MRLNSSFDINLNYLSDNVDLIKETASQSLLAMVKADAYGHGLLEISKFLVLEKNIQTLGVASLGEALYLRQNFTEKDYQVVVFSDFNLQDKTNLEIIQNYNIEVVLSSLFSLDLFLNNSEFKKAKLYLKFDTGMHRLGISFDEVAKCISLIKNSGRKKVDHLLTHFSSSYLIQHKNNRTLNQLEVFSQIKKELEAHFEVRESSVSNSGAIEQKLGLEFSHVRPGLMLYGPQSYPDPVLVKKTKLISSLRTYVLKKRTIKKGDPIGYGGVVCPNDGVVIYLPLGYGDGLLTHLSGLDFCLNGVHAKVLGRVNMDMSCYLINSKDAEIFREGEEIFLWKNDNQVLEDIYTHSKTNAYHILTSITSRVPKRYFK